MLLAFQLVGDPVVPLNRTLLVVPCVAPKFIPAIVTCVPTAPDAGLTLVIPGVVPPPPLAGLNAAMAAPQMSEVFNVPLAETGPAAVWTRSSTANFVLGAAGTRSPMTYPLPAVNVLGLAVDRRPITRSPLVVVVADAVVGVLLLPCPVAVTSREFPDATPEYSRIANLRVPENAFATVIVFAPPAMFSA
jgi:hypothetical protein